VAGGGAVLHEEPEVEVGGGNGGRGTRSTRRHGGRGDARRDRSRPRFAHTPAARPARDVRLQWCHDREVEVLSGHTLSGPYPTITASPQGEVESNRRGVTSPEDVEVDTAGRER
jgi:hypothetical protein